MSWLNLLFGVAATLVVLYLIELAWSTIENWIEAQRSPESQIAELLKERLANGNYRVIGNVLNRRGQSIATQAWESNSLSDDIQEAFGEYDRIRIAY